MIAKIKGHGKGHLDLWNNFFLFSIKKILCQSHPKVCTPSYLYRGGGAGDVRSSGVKTGSFFK